MPKPNLTEFRDDVKDQAPFNQIAKDARSPRVACTTG